MAHFYAKYSHFVFFQHGTKSHFFVCVTIAIIFFCTDLLIILAEMCELIVTFGLSALDLFAIFTVYFILITFS